LTAKDSIGKATRTIISQGLSVSTSMKGLYRFDTILYIKTAFG